MRRFFRQLASYIVYVEDPVGVMIDQNLVLLLVPADVNPVRKYNSCNQGMAESSISSSVQCRILAHCGSTVAVLCDYYDRKWKYFPAAC